MTFTSKIKVDNGLVIQIPGQDYKQALIKLQERAEKKHGGYVTVTIGTPKRARSTGPRSQNSKVWGMVQDIYDQFDSHGIETDVNRIYEAMKRMAVSEGYPTRFNPIDGIEEPESQSRVSVEQDNILIRVIQRFADENNFYLTEYDEHGRTIKTIGGKPIDNK